MPGWFFKFHRKGFRQYLLQLVIQYLYFYSRLRV
jgi:hypothetical protein